MFISVWEQFSVQPVTLETIHGALGGCARFQLSYWDALILAAARQMGSVTVYSEDFNQGQDYDGIQVIDPFAVP
jgi:predicted nucleic acid-binding protein